MINSNDPTTTCSGPDGPFGRPLVGDCDGDGCVRINDLYRALAVGLGNMPVSACPTIACRPVVFVNCMAVAANKHCDGSDGNLATNHRKRPWQNGLYRDDAAGHAAVLRPMAHSQNARAAAIAAQ